MKKKFLALLLATLMLLTLATAAYADTTIEITAQPKTIAAPIGATGFARVEAEGQLSYRWFYKNADSEEWIDTASEMLTVGETLEPLWEGFDKDTIYVPVTEETLGREFKCVLTDLSGNTEETEPVTVVEAEASSVVILEAAPADIAALYGETGTATVKASSEADLSYTWLQYNAATETWEPAELEGADTDTVSVTLTEETVGQQLYCLIRSADGGFAETDAILVSERQPAGIVIDVQPTTIKAPIGKTAKATVQASSDAELSYQWYYMAKGGSSWQPSGFTGSKTDTISVPVIERRLGQQYKCVITNADGVTVETEPVTVENAEASAIEILNQPEDIHAKAGVSVDVSVYAESEAELSYQWYFKSVGSNSWQPSGFTGSKTDTLTVPVTARRYGQQYKCVITTADGGKAETGVITILQPEPSEIIIDSLPTDIEAKLGQEGTATVLAHSEAQLSYQWYFKAVGKDTWQASGFTGNKTETIHVPVINARIGQQYKCVIKTDDGSVFETEPVQVLPPMASEISLELQPENMYGFLGDYVSATAKASVDSNVTLKYQWYFMSRGGSTWQVSGMSGCKTDTITVQVTSARIGQKYKCVITASDGTKIETEPVTICEKPGQAFAIMRNPDSYRAYVGAPVELEVAVNEGEELSYQWYKDGVAIPGATSSRLYFAEVSLEDAGEYTCVVTGYGYSVTSRVGTVSVRE